MSFHRIIPINATVTIIHHDCDMDRLRTAMENIPPVCRSEIQVTNNQIYIGSDIALISTAIGLGVLYEGDMGDIHHVTTIGEESYSQRLRVGIDEEGIIIYQYVE